MSLFEKLSDDAVIPVRATKGSAGYDLFVIDDVRILYYEPGFETTPQLVKTGIKINIPEGYCGQIWGRSSLAKKGLVVLAGLVDSDYQGEVMVLLSNLGDNDIHIKKGEKVAQLVIVPYYKEDGEEVDGVRDGGFGSTGA